MLKRWLPSGEKVVSCPGAWGRNCLCIRKHCRAEARLRLAVSEDQQRKTRVAGTEREHRTVGSGIEETAETSGVRCWVGARTTLYKAIDDEHTEQEQRTALYVVTAH